MSSFQHKPLLIRTKTTAHCIPEEPPIHSSPKSLVPSLTSGESNDELEETKTIETAPRRRRASTILVSQNSDDVRRILGEGGTQPLVQCCGGGCQISASEVHSDAFESVTFPDNDAYRSLQLNIGALPKQMTAVPGLPEKTVSLVPVKDNKKVAQLLREVSAEEKPHSKESIDFTPHTAEIEEKLHHDRIPTSAEHPPKFVKPVRLPPFPPYGRQATNTFSSIHHTKSSAPRSSTHASSPSQEHKREPSTSISMSQTILSSPAWTSRSEAPLESKHQTKNPWSKNSWTSSPSPA